MEVNFPVLRKGETQYMLLRNDWTWLSLDNVVKRFSQGSLWISNHEEDEQGTLCNVRDGINVQWESCPKNLFDVLMQLDFDLLLGVSQDIDRFLIYQHRDWLAEGRDLTIGDQVKIQNVSRMPSDATGYIRFKNHPVLEDGSKSGILFGIELSRENCGQGTSNGSFRKRTYFKCDENCAVFYSLKCIRRKNAATPTSSMTESIAQLSLRSGGRQDPTRQGAGAGAGPDGAVPYLAGEAPIPVGEDVVWYSDNGPERGTIRWIGQIPELDPIQKWYAGVEFENAIGKGTGRYKGIQLFFAEKDHASLVPVAGLIRSRDFEESSEPRTMDPDPTWLPYRESFNGRALSNELGASAMPTYQQNGRHVSTGDTMVATAAKAVKHPAVHDKKPSSARGVEREPNRIYTQSNSGVAAQASLLGTASQLNSDNSYDFQTYEFVSSRTKQPQISFTGPPADMHVQLLEGEQQQQEVNEPESTTSITLASAQTSAGIFKLDERVRVLSPPRFGVIRWLGKASREESVHKDRVTAGLEMESPDMSCYTDGTFQGQRMFKCQPYRAFFIYLKKCRRDSDNVGAD